MAFSGSDSQTKSRTQTISGPQTAAEGGKNIASQGRGRIASDGGVVTGNNANFGLSFGNVGRGATVTLQATDGGAVAAATALVERTINSQATFGQSVLSEISKLSETKISDGANISADVNKSGFSAVLGIALVAGLVALVFIFKK